MLWLHEPLRATVWADTAITCAERAGSCVPRLHLASLVYILVASITTGLQPDTACRLSLCRVHPVAASGVRAATGVGRYLCI